MLAVLCPQCGRPVRIALSSPDVVRCPACRYSGPPGADAKRALDSAAAVLARLDRSMRQLSHDQARAVARARGRLREDRRFLLGTMGFTALLLLWLSKPGVIVPTASLWATPLTIALGIGVVALLGGRALAGLRRRIAILEDSWAAIPPPSAGEPAACHVCGAPVHLGGDPAVVRCSYCGADNLVDPDVLERASRSSSVVVKDLDDAIEQHATALAVLTGQTTESLFAIVIAMPIVAPIFTLMASLVLASIDVPLDPRERYAVDYKVEELSPQLTWRCACLRRGNTTDSPFDPRSLEGKKMCATYDARLARVVGNAYTGNHAVVARGPQEIDTPLDRLCVRVDSAP